MDLNIPLVFVQASFQLINSIKVFMRNCINNIAKIYVTYECPHNMVSIGHKYGRYTVFYRA